MKPSLVTLANQALKTRHLNICFLLNLLNSCHITCFTFRLPYNQINDKVPTTQSKLKIVLTLDVNSVRLVNMILSCFKNEEKTKKFIEDCFFLVVACNCIFTALLLFSYFSFSPFFFPLLVFTFY